MQNSCIGSLLCRMPRIEPTKENIFMFLNLLNQTEKDQFMKLAIAVIKVDGCTKEREEQLLSTYIKELQIPMCDFSEQYDILHIIEEIATKSTKQIQRIIFIELVALAFSDGNYAFEEKLLIQQLITAFQFEPAFVEQVINLEDAYISVYMSLINLIEEGE